MESYGTEAFPAVRVILMGVAVILGVAAFGVVGELPTAMA